VATSFQQPSPGDGSLLPTKRVHGLLLCKVLGSVCPLLVHMIPDSFLFVASV